MSLCFCVVCQTWRACPSVFVGLCSLKSQRGCLAAISASLFPAFLLRPLSPRSALSLTLSHSIYRWRRDMIKTSSWADSKSFWGKVEGGQSYCIIKVMTRVGKRSWMRNKRLCQKFNPSPLWCTFELEWWHLQRGYSSANQHQWNWKKAAWPHEQIKALIYWSTDSAKKTEELKLSNWFHATSVWNILLLKKNPLDTNISYTSCFWNYNNKLDDILSHTN